MCVLLVPADDKICVDATIALAERPRDISDRLTYVILLSLFGWGARIRTANSGICCWERPILAAWTLWHTWRTTRWSALLVLELQSDMNEGRTKMADDSDLELRPQYDFSKGVRGKYAARYGEGSNVVFLDPDVAATFKTPQAVNDALRELIRTRGAGGV